MLLKQPDPDLRTLVVWVPKLGGAARDVPVATRLVPDDRAEHYWDENAVVMGAFTKAMGLPEDAWDVYLIYGPAAHWDGEVPPAPDYWMHQLGSRNQPRVAGPYLDPAVFAAKANAILGSR